ncbi:MAG: hypothetical protein ACPGWR_28165, partial [Ardenticatenaceae bacterium]
LFMRHQNGVAYPELLSRYPIEPAPDAVGLPSPILDLVAHAFCLSDHTQIEQPGKIFWHTIRKVSVTDHPCPSCSQFSIL